MSTLLVCCSVGPFWSRSDLPGGSGYVCGFCLIILLCMVMYGHAGWCVAILLGAYFVLCVCKLCALTWWLAYCLFSVVLVRMLYAICGYMCGHPPIFMYYCCCNCVMCLTWPGGGPWPDWSSPPLPAMYVLPYRGYDLVLVVLWHLCYVWLLCSTYILHSFGFVMWLWPYCRWCMYVCFWVQGSGRVFCFTTWGWCVLNLVQPWCCFFCPGIVCGWGVPPSLF